MHILIGIQRGAIALRSPQRFAQAFEDRVFGVVHLESLAKRLVGGTKVMATSGLESAGALMRACLASTQQACL